MVDQRIAFTLTGKHTVREIDSEQSQALGTSQSHLVCGSNQWVRPASLGQPTKKKVVVAVLLTKLLPYTGQYPWCLCEGLGKSTPGLGPTHETNAERQYVHANTSV